MRPRRAIADDQQRVSIHTRHFCRVMQEALDAEKRFELVSIHTRHFCRVMRERPALTQDRAKVSIHTRHFCRVMRGGELDPVRTVRFQSTPDISAG